MLCFSPVFPFLVHHTCEAQDKKIVSVNDVGSLVTRKGENYNESYIRVYIQRVFWKRYMPLHILLINRRDIATVGYVMT